MTTLQLSKFDHHVQPTRNTTPKAAAAPMAPAQPLSKSRFALGLALAACVQTARPTHFRSFIASQPASERPPALPRSLWHVAQ